MSGHVNATFGLDSLAAFAESKILVNRRRRPGHNIRAFLASTCLNSE
jgi:hypothetical protein